MNKLRSAKFPFPKFQERSSGDEERFKECICCRRAEPDNKPKILKVHEIEEEEENAFRNEN